MKCSRFQRIFTWRKAFLGEKAAVCCTIANNIVIMSLLTALLRMKTKECGMTLGHKILSRHW
jgi:hypothetical protein